jgi:propanol-preferring alcohol dehydrogenase
MTATMRAYRLTGWRRGPEPVEVAVPSPGPGEVLVRVAGCGLCRSDLGMRELPPEVGDLLGWSMPFTLGHEAAGWVAAVGRDVAGFSEGDAVAITAGGSCGTCWHCVRGMDNACPSGLVGRGFGRDGGLADYVLVDHPRRLLRLRALDPRHAGPLTDAGATAYHAVRRALPRIFPGGTVAVFGAGGLGAFAIQFLRLLTAARVVAVDTNPDRLAYARELGAHDTLAGVDRETTGAVRALADGRGADAVLDFVGVDTSIRAGVAATRAGGAYGLIGAAGGTLKQGWFGALPKDGEVFTFQGSGIADAQEVFALADAGLLRNEVAEFDFDAIDSAYAHLADGSLHGRAVIVLDAP